MDVIILAAGNISDRIHFINFNITSPALIPVNVRSSVSYIIEVYMNSNEQINNIYLVVNDIDLLAVKNELKYYKNLKIIGLPTTKNVIHTLYEALNVIENLKEDLMINLVTTIPLKVIDSNTILLENEIKNNIEWSGISKNNESFEFIYKSDKIKKCHAFTGVLRINSIKLKYLITKILDKSDLLSLVETYYNHEKIVFDYDTWIDCGHEINYYDAKSKLVSSRSFNSIKINDIEGTLTKTSTNVDKFLNEVNYVSLLPDDISVFFPNNYSKPLIINDVVSVKMEYYGYPTLAEYMLYWKLENFSWERIFSAIFYIIEKFRVYSYSIGYTAYKQFLFDKHNERVEVFKEQLIDRISLAEILFDNEIFINGKKYKNLSLINKDIMNKIDLLYNESDFCIIHGDLCFNNILYDLKSNVIRLIDARGSFGEKCKGIYGDNKYDIAKITHSAIGGYDFIVNNLFELVIDYQRKEVNYQILYRDNYSVIMEQNKELIRKCGYKEEDIMFMVGLLFVSMCPFHDDDIERQILMYVHGIKYINENLEDIK